MSSTLRPSVAASLSSNALMAIHDVRIFVSADSGRGVEKGSAIRIASAMVILVEVAVPGSFIIGQWRTCIWNGSVPVVEPVRGAKVGCKDSSERRLRVFALILKEDVDESEDLCTSESE